MGSCSLPCLPQELEGTSPGPAPRKRPRRRGLAYEAKFQTSGPGGGSPGHARTGRGMGPPRLEVPVLFRGCCGSRSFPKGPCGNSRAGSVGGCPTLSTAAMGFRPRCRLSLPVVAVDHIRHHRLADQYGPAAGRGISEPRPLKGRLLPISAAGFFSGSWDSSRTTAPSGFSRSSHTTWTASDRSRQATVWMTLARFGERPRQAAAGNGRRSGTWDRHRRGWPRLPHPRSSAELHNQQAGPRGPAFSVPWETAQETGDTTPTLQKSQ